MKTHTQTREKQVRKAIAVPPSRLTKATIKLISTSQIIAPSEWVISNNRFLLNLKGMAANSCMLPDEIVRDVNSAEEDINWDQCFSSLKVSLNFKKLNWPRGVRRVAGKLVIRTEATVLAEFKGLSEF